MGKIRQSLLIAGQNFSKWPRSPRTWMVFVIAFILCLMLSDKILSYAQNYEISLQIVEPFIWIYGDSTSVLLSSLLLILLFADMPFVDSVTPYTLIRTKRSIWLLGQMIYVCVGTIIYNIFLLVSLMILTAPFAYIGNLWSETAALLGYGGSAGISIPVSVKTMESSMPYECAGKVFVLMFLYSLFIAGLMLWLNLLKYSGAGVIGAFAVELYGFLLNPEVFQKVFHFTGNLEYKANVLCGWLSPLSHATFSMHDFGYDYLPKISVSIVIFLVLIIVFIIFALIKMRTYNFIFVQVDE